LVAKTTSLGTRASCENGQGHSSLVWTGDGAHGLCELHRPNSGDKHRYIATGDSGQGITNGVIASMLIANLIVDGNSPWVKAYDPARMITKNIGGYLRENMTVLRSFAEYLTMGEVAAIEGSNPAKEDYFAAG
jgi:hypothetical protein